MERQKAPFWQQAILFRLLLPFCLGILTAEYTAGIVAQALVPIIGLTATLSLFLLPKELPSWTLGLASMLACYTTGYWIHSRTHQEPDPRIWTHTNSACICYVQKAYPKKGNHQKLEVSILGNVQHCFRNTRAILFVQQHARTMQAGDTIMTSNKWERIRNSGIPGDIDLRQHYARKQIYLRGFSTGQTVRLLYRHTQSQQSFPDRIHHAATNILDKYLPDARTNALLKAMLLGDEQEIDSETRKAYADTGIIHIISISGAHVALLFSLIQAALFWLSGRRRKLYLFIVSTVLIFLYVAMAGAPSSAVRAAAMFLFLQMGILSGQRHNPLNQLCAAALIMLAFRSSWLFHIGFQLSFVAVSSLLLFYRPLLRLWPAKHPLSCKLRNAIAASIAAEILVAPLAAYYFHHFPLLFLPANLIAAAGMTLIESMGLALMLLSPFDCPAGILAQCLDVVSDVFHMLIFSLQDRSPDSMKQIYISTSGLLIIYLIIAAISQFIKTRSARAAYIALLSLCALSTLHLIHTIHNARNQQLILWWRKRVPNGLITDGFHTRKLKSYDCELSAIEALLIRRGLSYPRGHSAGRFQIAGQSIVNVDSTILPATPLYADVVLLQVKQHIRNPDIYLSQLHATTWVLASYLPKQHLRNWRDKCAQRKIRLHYLPADGPFVLQRLKL